MKARLVKKNEAWDYLEVGRIYDGKISNSGYYFYIDGLIPAYNFEGNFEEVKDEKPNKYSVQISGESADVYDVLKAFNVVNPALQHLIKKALKVGNRGHKDAATDYQDIIDSAIRAKELG